VELGVITHHCHRLHNIPVQFFFRTELPLARPRDASCSRRGRLVFTRHGRQTDRRRCLPPPPAGRTAGIDRHDPPAAPSASCSRFCSSSWSASASSNPRWRSWSGLDGRRRDNRPRRRRTQQPGPYLRPGLVCLGQGLRWPWPGRGRPRQQHGRSRHERRIDAGQLEVCAPVALSNFPCSRTY
jgi:hypothetical protein